MRPESGPQRGAAPFVRARVAAEVVARSTREAATPRSLERDRAAVRQAPVPEFLLLDEDELLLKIAVLPNHRPDPVRGARGGALFVALVRLPQPKQPLPAIGHPPRYPLFANPGFRFVQAQKILVRCPRPAATRCAFP